MQAEELWQRTLSLLRDRFSTTSYETLVRPTRAVSLEHQTLVLEAPNAFARDWISRNMADLHGALAEAGRPDTKIVFRLADMEPMLAGPQPVITAVVPAMPAYGTLNPKYTFDSFVVGNHSRFAHAASFAVAENPAKAYNPLFLYGGVGLGKTHLMQAIGHQLLARNPRTKVAYLSSERFTNEMIHSLKEDRMADFRGRYRSIDLLLIDDIQFIQGKDATQEEFFHTFNALHEAGKQIVISSDRPPKNLAGLQDRMISRFEWGLLTDVQTPDLETRIAILQKKAETEGLSVDGDVLAYIASNYQSNIRELEGAFIRVMAFASLHDGHPNLELAMQVLGVAVRQPVTIERIRALVAEHFRIPEADLRGGRRTKDIAWARQVAMYLCRELTEASFPKIGGEFGGRDHTTVMYACERIGTLKNGDPTLQELLARFASQLKS